MHDYFGLDLEIIWQIIRSDLPALKRDLPPGETDIRSSCRSGSLWGEHFLDKARHVDRRNG
jgi:hypothetical protein